MVLALKEIKLEDSKLPVSLGELSPALQTSLQMNWQSYVELFTWKQKLKLLCLKLSFVPHKRTAMSLCFRTGIPESLVQRPSEPRWHN